MAQGGARNRSGPAKDPNALRRQRDGFTLRQIPSAEYTGEVPRFPLPDKSFDEESLWQYYWKQPQAHVWATEPYRWPTIAMYVRTFVRCADNANARTADVNSLHRLADQIGLTPAGLKENGWAIAQNEIAAKAEERAEGAVPATQQSAKERLRLITDAS